MNNILSYCGLVDAKIRAFDKDLPLFVADADKRSQAAQSEIQFLQFLQ